MEYDVMCIYDSGEMVKILLDVYKCKKCGREVIRHGVIKKGERI